MAIETANNNNETTTSKKKDADGFLNLQVPDAAGNLHSVKAYIPLDRDNRVHRALLNKSVADGQPHATIQIIGTIVVVDKDQPEIEL